MTGNLREDVFQDDQSDWWGCSVQQRGLMKVHKMKLKEEFTISFNVVTVQRP
jgi:hypothetical protein